MLSLGLGLTSIPVLARRSGGGSYDPDALAFFERLTTPPTDERKALYNALIVDLKTAGVWEKLDALYILAAADAQAARQNLTQDAYNLTAVGSPMFTADRGYTGDGVGAYLAPGFNPTTAPSPKYTQNSASIFTWERSELAGATTSSLAASAGNRVSLVPRSTGDIIRSALNNGLSGTLSVASNVGLTAADRLNSTDVLHIKDGVLVEAVSVASETVASGDFDLMRRNSAVYRASPMTTAGFGASLGVSGQAALRAALNTYLTAVGAN
jgi:hypothetical protein